MTTLEKVYRKNKDWVRICMSFGCNKTTAEDLTQEMYLKLATLLQNNHTLDIYYDESQINHFYIYRMLRSLFIDIINFSEKVSPVFTPENLEDRSPRMNMIYHD